MKVETYNLWLNGHYVRKATKVTYPSGKVIKFLEKLPKGEAIRQAGKHVAMGL